MATTCPSGFDKERMTAEVMATYSRVAANPDDDYHFHRGPDYASRLLGYDREELESLPATSTARFAGVANPLRIGPVHPGEVVLDIGCGAGTDLLLAARRVGPDGRAIGVDMTAAMREVCLRSAKEAGLDGIVELREGTAESLPLEDASVDVVISNGVLNLTPDKERAFQEIHRVLKPGGRLYLGDVAIDMELHLHEREDPELWAGCVGGAVLERELSDLALRAGLSDPRIVERFDAYSGTSAGDKVAPKVGVKGVNFFARR